MGLHPDRVDHAVGPASRGHPAEPLCDVVRLCDVHGLDAVRARPRQSFWHQVDSDDLRGAAMLGHPRAHLADRAEAEYGDAARLRDLGVLDGLPRGRQHVGQVDEAIVGRSFRHLDRAVVGLRDAQVLGLATRDLAVELCVAEQGGPRALVADLGRLALGLEAVVAHPARAAGDVERDHDAVALGDVLDVGTDLLDHAHRLVAEHVTGSMNGPSTS